MLGLLLNLNRDEWFIAIIFGVALDIDHLFAAPRYLGDNGMAALLRPTWDDGSGLPWKSLLHHPVGFFVVAPLSVGWHYLLPLLFWGLHVGIDEFQNATLEHNTAMESTLFVAACLGIFLVEYRRWSSLAPESTVSAYLYHLARKARASLHF